MVRVGLSLFVYFNDVLKIMKIKSFVEYFKKGTRNILTFSRNFQIIQSGMFHCAALSVSDVGARPTDKKSRRYRPVSASLARSSWAGVSDEAAVISQVSRKH